MQSLVDLHLHTTASDGATGPHTLLRECESAGLRTISFCDHESINGYRRIADVMAQSSLTVIPGVELLTTYKKKEIHLLGYYFNPEHPGFNQRLKELRSLRNDTAIQVAEKLIKLGYQISVPNLIDIADRDITLGKNHLIYALFEAGYIKTFEDVVGFLRNYLSQYGKAYVDFEESPFAEAVEFIRMAGGMPVLAHPGLIRDDAIVRELLTQNQVGIEVYYLYFGDMRQQWIDRYEAMALEYNLIVTGGSDYHGYYAPDVSLGELDIPDRVVTSIQKRIAIRGLDE